MALSRLVPVAALGVAVGLAVACGSSDDKPAATSTPAGSIAATPDTSGVCARPIPALTAQPVTKERLESAIAQMGEVKEAAEAGDRKAATAAFSGDAHAVTHDIDPPLRSADPSLAEDLCASIVVIEQQFSGAGDLEAVAGGAESAAGLLEESGRALGSSSNRSGAARSGYVLSARRDPGGHAGPPLRPVDSGNVGVDVRHEPPFA